MAVHKISTVTFATLESQKGYTGTSGTQETNILNPYTQGFTKNDNEKDLIHSLTMESIQMNGVEGYYIYRNNPNIDIIFGEDPTAIFDDSFPIAMYVESYDQYNGNGDLYSKFGFQVNDEITLSINPFLFNNQVNNKSNKPREGDLIYFAMGKALFEITWVEDEKPWYQNGTLPILKITAQKFIYSNETIAMVETDMGNIGDIGELPQDIIDDIESLNGLMDTYLPNYEEPNKIQTDFDNKVSSDNQNPFI